MRIEQIQTFLADRFFFVRLTTDDDTQGTGERTFWSFPRAAELVVNSCFDMLLGHDPMIIEHI